jgi:arylsulfatase A-like enzyme
MDRFRAQRRSIRYSVAWSVALTTVYLLLGFATARASGDTRPSILLIVIDTLRANAVSVYGSVEGTTPTLDALAAEGLVYKHAYASAPWTLPSHATIFSGLRVDQHRVGMPGQPVLSEEVLTLAERMQAAGYETAAISENVIVSDLFQLLQGFEHRRSTAWHAGAMLGQPPVEARVDVPYEVRKWLANRNPGRPFFLFVNLNDPHSPYKIRGQNPFVPDGVSESEIKRRSAKPHWLICSGLPRPDKLAVQWGLYLGEVAAADVLVGEIIRLVREPAFANGLITIATSDHGEFFGERNLMGHEFSLQSAVLQVPLIVHGLDGVQPSTIEQPVGLVDVAPSILRWTGIEVRDELAGDPLPRLPEPSRARERVFLAAYSDEYKHNPEFWDGEFKGEDKGMVRQFCASSDRVFGGMASLIRYPLKFHWFERYPPELYDLSWDPKERSNQAKFHPELVERFTSEVKSFVEAAGLESSSPTATDELSNEAIEALKGLGYVE